MSNIVIHFSLAALLFIIQNWIGSRSYSKGYIRFSLLDDKNEALSLNFVLKVFGPIVYLIIVVAIFQYLNNTEITNNIINVVYYYLGIRILFIFLYERALIVNWARIIFHYASIVLVSIIIYMNFIDSVETLLPDFSEIKNEIWILILLFLYQIGNGVDEKQISNPLYEPEQAFLPELKNRKKKYIIKKHKKLQSEYEQIISEISNNNNSFNLIIYAILIFENFNRPRIVRWVERVWVRISNNNVTQGIMQVSSNKEISDKKSVINGTKNLYENYKKYLQQEYAYNTFQKVIKRHCPDKKYVRQVLFIAKAVIDNEGGHKKYNEIFNDIKSEFRLYDFYD